MKLLVLILKKVDLINDIIKKLVESGVKGGTMIEGTGMAKALIEMEDIPMLEILKHILTNEEVDSCKVMILVLKDEQVKATRDAIKSVVGDFNQPNTGIMFTIPITEIDGIGRQ